MRKVLAAIFPVLLMATATVASQTMAKVQLPCDSRSQVLSPTGAQLVAQCKDGSLYLVDLPDGRQQSIASAERHANTYAFSPDGRWLAVGFPHGVVEVLSTKEKASTRQWTADSHRIDNLYFFPDGKHLFVGPVDSPGTVWELADTPMLRATVPMDFGGIAACAVSPNGKQMVVAGDDTVLRWYDTATWQKTRDYRGFLLETFALAFTPDGKQLLAGGADARITVFDAASGKQLRQSPPEAGSSVFAIEMLGKTPQVLTAYFDNAGTKPPYALVWDIATAKLLPIKTSTQPTCGSVVGDTLWLCQTDGRTLTIWQAE
jgi:WD40 repeat protein